MSCQKCKSDRVLDIGGKCSDMFHASSFDSEIEGYVPKGLGIGHGDYIEFAYCLDCGQIQGQFPIDRKFVEDNEDWDHEKEDDVCGHDPRRRISRCDRQHCLDCDSYIEWSTKDDQWHLSK